MKKLILSGFLISSVFASSYAFAWKVNKTENYGGTTYYQIICNNGSIRDVNDTDGAYGATRNGVVKVFYNLSAAASYACGE